jgi:hypothetical protein
MAHVDETARIVADPGEALRVEYHLRPSDYGGLLTPYGKPFIGVNHTSGNYLPLGADSAAVDGTLTMARRVANARFYPHGYLSRDGLFCQTVLANRSCIACSGHWQAQEINRVAFQVEIVGLGWTSLTGRYPTGADATPINVDPHRADLRKYGRRLYQAPTEVQVRALCELWRAIVLWSGMPPAEALHRHLELAPQDGHDCPGEAITELLRTQVAASLGVN